jgi:hypothetical protein
MTPHDFKAKWSPAAANERQWYQEHFNDLCDLLNHPRPSGANKADLSFTFEYPLTKAAGTKGFADVSLQGHFGWEYKGPGGNLALAYNQLLGYKSALDNPPLLIVSDNQRIRIHPQFPNQPDTAIEVTLEGIASGEGVETLRRVFTDPDSFRTGPEREKVTQTAAARFGQIAQTLHTRGHEPRQIAHFLVQILFCLFAEDTGILPRGLFTKLLTFAAAHPAQFTAQLTSLLESMATGGYFNMETIPWVNGGLFADITVLPLEADELKVLATAAQLDWSAVEPAIFGTLFERSLDPAQRAQLGAHYTGRPDIIRVVEPVVMAPLRRRWEEVRTEAEPLYAKWQATPRGRTSDKAWTDARTRL